MLEDIVIESMDKWYKTWTIQRCQINNAKKKNSKALFET